MRLPTRILGVWAVSLTLAATAAAGSAVPRQVDFLWPADGTVTSPFGYRGGGFHPGIDIGMLRSLTVRAAADGTVTLVGSVSGYEGYGNIVAVNIGGGMTTIYAHLSRTRVHVGDYVQAGDWIAVAGCTGSCSGTHLHFELRSAGRPIDPIPFLPQS